MTAFKARTVPTRSPLAFQIGSEEHVGAELGRRDVQKKATPELGLLGRGFEFALPEQEELGAGGMRHGGPSPMRMGPHSQSLASRVASLQFISSEQSQAMTEMDSILDVQLPEERDGDATTSFGIRRQTTQESQRPEFTPAHRRQESAPLHKRQESASSVQRQAPEPTHRRQESAPVHGRTLSVPSRTHHESAYSHRAVDAANDTLPEDELTLNIAALGLSGFANTPLVDTSLDQLESKTEMGDGTFGGPSFIEAGPSTSEVRKREFLDAKSRLDVRA